MNPRAVIRNWILAFGLLAMAILSCGRMSPRSTMTDNQRPEVALDAPSLTADPSQRFTWRGNDPDGRIDHYLYAVNPASVDRIDGSWVRTDQTRALVQFPRVAAIGRASQPESEAKVGARIFAVRAVDDRGEASAPAVIAVDDSNQVEPIVIIVAPQPNPVFTPLAPPSLDIQWHGEDLDGRIVQYKYRLFTRNNPDFPGIPDFIAFVMNDPSQLANLYGPGYASWDSVMFSKTSVHYSGLVRGEVYLFAITAIDDDGNSGSVFSGYTNVLRFGVTDDNDFKPRLCVQSPFFTYCSPTGDDIDLSYEIPGARAVRVSWSATVPQSGVIDGYRWTLDPRDTTNTLGLGSTAAHWTPWSLSNTFADVGPFASSSTPHVLWIQARDSGGRITTGKVRLTAVGGAPTRELLVVDDTRLTPDRLNADGTLAPPVGTWPSAAELDTFLYARGGYPWSGYPGGAISPPGILNGYDFDTLGTRGNASGFIPLSVLSQYRQVLWITDDVGATYTQDPAANFAPSTILRWMSRPGQANYLSFYAAAGGKVWIMGGGAAYATLVDWSRRNTPDDWTNTDLELVPGRFMYDYSHWRSAVAVRPARQAFVNTTAWSPWPNAAPGRGWSGHGLDHNLSQPDYNKLGTIQVLSSRTCGSDPPPPQRFCNSFYLVTSYSAEYIGRVPGQFSPPNIVVEDADPHAIKVRMESTLDTLYTAVGGSMPSPLPVMTYYHGFESGPVVFSGFPVWYFQKAQCQQLVDFVLHDIWGLSKQAPATTAAMASRRR